MGVNMVALYMNVCLSFKMKLLIFLFQTIDELYKLAELIVGPVIINQFSQRRQYL